MVFFYCCCDSGILGPRIFLLEDGVTAFIVPNSNEPQYQMFLDEIGLLSSIGMFTNY